MTRILFVSHMSERNGGAIEILRLLLRYMPPGLEPGVIIPTRGAVSNLLDDMAIAWYCMPLHIQNIHNIPRLAQSIINRLAPLIFVPRLAQLIIRDRWDVVYANCLIDMPRLAFWSAWLAGRPFIWHAHEVMRTVPRSTAVVLRHSAAVIAVSEACAMPLRSYAGDRLHVIPNGLDLCEFAVRDRRLLRSLLGLGDGERIVLNVGRVCKQKNQRDTLLAVGPLLAEMPELHLCFLGYLQEGEYVAELKALAVQLGVADRVHLLGHRADAHQLLCGSDVLVHTSTTEAHPLVLLEAMAAGVPVVAYDVGGVGEIVVDGETGFMVPFGQHDQLADRIRFILRDRALAQAMGETGHNRTACSFSAEETARRVEQVVMAVVSAHLRTDLRGR